MQEISCLQQHLPLISDTLDVLSSKLDEGLSKSDLLAITDELNHKITTADQAAGTKFCDVVNQMSNSILFAVFLNFLELKRRLCVEALFVKMFGNQHNYSQWKLQAQFKLKLDHNFFKS